MRGSSRTTARRSGERGHQVVGGIVQRPRPDHEVLGPDLIDPRDHGSRRSASATGATADHPHRVRGDAWPTSRSSSGPCWSRRPSRSTPTVSHTSWRSARMCVERTTVAFPELASRVTRSSTSRRPAGSSAEHGSSSRRICGRLPRLRRAPPLEHPPREPADGPVRGLRHPASSRTSTTRSRDRERRGSGPGRNFRRGEHGRTTACLAGSPPGDARPTGAPSRRTVGGARPGHRSVVFPAPFGPTSPKTDPPGREGRRRPARTGRRRSWRAPRTARRCAARAVRRRRPGTHLGFRPTIR